MSSYLESRMSRGAGGKLFGVSEWFGMERWNLARQPADVCQERNKAAKVAE